MSGDSGAAKRQGEMRSISAGVTGRPSAASSTPGSLAAALRGSKPVTTGLSASTVRPAARKCRIRPAATKVLPMSVPVAVMKIAVMRCRRMRGAHEVGKPRDLGVGMRGAERKPQPRGALRHRRRADGDGEKAFGLEKLRRRERRLGLADHHRHDRRFAPAAGRRRG